MNQLRLFNETLQARFLSRPNRLLIRCEWNSKTISAFLPNPGRLQELLLPGRMIYLVKEEGLRHRKTYYTALAVERDGYPIMLQTFRTNEVAIYPLNRGKIPGFGSSDCSCETHLFGMKSDPLLSEDFHKMLPIFQNGWTVANTVKFFPIDELTKFDKVLLDIRLHSH